MNSTSKSIVCVSVPTLAFVVSMLAPAAAQYPGKIWIMNSRSNNLCIRPLDKSPDVKAVHDIRTTQWPCELNDRSYKWTMVSTDRLDPTIVAIVNINSGLCLAIAGGSTAIGAYAVQSRCDGGPSRFWRFVVVPNGNWQLVNVNSGLCLHTFTTTRNVPQSQRPCNENDPRTLWYTTGWD
jgi:hypothetical protein